jgi:hypothetical protein
LAGTVLPLALLPTASVVGKKARVTPPPLEELRGSGVRELVSVF